MKKNLNIEIKDFLSVEKVEMDFEADCIVEYNIYYKDICICKTYKEPTYFKNIYIVNPSEKIPTLSQVFLEYDSEDDIFGDIQTLDLCLDFFKTEEKALEWFAQPYSFKTVDKSLGSRPITYLSLYHFLTDIFKFYFKDGAFCGNYISKEIHKLFVDELRNKGNLTHDWNFNHWKLLLSNITEIMYDKENYMILLTQLNKENFINEDQVFLLSKLWDK